jgi:hypothetical protein
MQRKYNTIKMVIKYMLNNKRKTLKAIRVFFNLFFYIKLHKFCCAYCSIDYIKAK